MKQAAISDEMILDKLHAIRGQKVLLDRDLANLYGVQTKVLKQAVRRNADRFPSDFMFELSTSEFADLRSQIVTSSHGGTRYPPMAFTEHGVLMLSSVLRSERAVQMNIQIMRIFVRMREILLTHKNLLLKLSAIEAKLGQHDQQLSTLYAYIKQLVKEQDERESVQQRKRIGFHPT
ncbi:MAG: ORF6N domain-containing protein [Saprospiraceae bacterium]|nr:ORF6N domain-containing protein [Saprospiraceae bacterium]